MKRFLLHLLLICLPLFSLCQIRPFEIFGTISGHYNGKMYLFFEDNYRQRDSISSEIKNGRFYFKGMISMPVQARLHMDQQSLIRDFYMDGSKTFVHCTTKMNIRNNGEDTLNMLTVLSVNGSKIEKIKSDLEKRLNRLQQSKSVDAYKQNAYYRTLFTFISEHPKSKLSPYFLGKASLLSSVQIKELSTLIDSSLHNSFEAKTIADLLHELDKSQNSIIGANFHDFVLKDTTDSEISSKQFRGKHTLVVIWASWCKPCRAEHPELNRLYEKYKSRELEMVGLSLDKSKLNWTKAIIKDKLLWTQVIDTNAFDGDIATYYDIDAIPANFLLDQEGKIIGTGLTTEEIDAILAISIPTKYLINMVCTFW